MAHCASFPSPCLRSCQTCYKRRHISTLSRHIKVDGTWAHLQKQINEPCSCRVFIFLLQHMTKSPVPHDRSGRPESHRISIAHQTGSNACFINWCDVFEKILQKQKHFPHSLHNWNLGSEEIKCQSDWWTGCICDWKREWTALKDACLCICGIYLEKVSMQLVNWEKRPARMYRTI